MKDILVKKIKIQSIPALIVMPRKRNTPSTGVLWIHGGGYFLGMKEMVFMSRAMDLVKNHGCVVLCPGYRLAPLHKYPAAIEDCYKALVFLKEHANELGVRSNQIMVGGESAGGGLCASLCMMARDKQEVNIAFQMPLYPMLDNFDTPSSKDNHGKVWNTKRNHLGWKLYLGKDNKKVVSCYAAAARQSDYSNLPPAYTFVGDQEPFYCETISYIENLKKQNIPARMDIYPMNMHAFDMLKPNLKWSKVAIELFNNAFSYAQQHYFAKQPPK